MIRRRLRQIFFLLGLIFLIYLLRQIGWDTLAQGFRRLGWVLVLILLLSGIKYVISAFAWAAAFFPDERQSWRELFGYRLAGEALSYLSLAGPLVGTPVKASLLPRVRFLPALASTLLETTVNTLAGTSVIVAGLVLLLLWHAPGNMLRYASYLAILVLLAFVFAFLYALKHRVPMLTGPWRHLRFIPGLSAPKLGEKLLLVEQRMHRLRAERPGALLLIFILSFAAQGLALLEIYVVVVPLGIAPTLSSLLVLEGVTKLAKALFFFVPARIGADEGSTVGVFALLGFSPATGLMLALARRLRAIFWSAAGLAVLLAHSMRSISRQPEVEARS